MPPLTDRARIRTRLDHDRPWSAFALADLEPAHDGFASWFGPATGSTVVLVYGAYDPPIVMLHGDPAECDALLGEPALVHLTPRAYLNVTTRLLPVADRHFAVFGRRSMLRMLFEPAGAAVRDTPRVVRLGPEDLPQVLTLYAEEPPGFFRPEQLRDGVYFGIREGRELVAIAGTHVLSTAAAVGALGNVHTRHDRRRQGLAAEVVTAVVRELRRMRIATIVLNIVGSNETARRVYERVGFREYCAYFEGVASR